MQAIELAMGELPREYQSWDEVQGWHKDLFPTPRVSGGSDIMNLPPSSIAGKHGLDLGPAVGSLLPTPVAHDDGKTPEAHRAMKERMGHGRKAITSLGVMAQTLLPTPQAHDAAGAKTPEQVAIMRGRGHGVSNLNEAATHLLPTPKANDGKGATITHGRTRSDGRPYGDGDANLPLRVIELLPTPLSGEARHGSPGQHRTRGDKMLTGEVLGLLPTPRANDGNGIGVHGVGGNDLRTEISLLPTPDTHAAGGAQAASKRRQGGHAVRLQDQAVELLPSPMAADGSRGSTTFARGNPTLKGALLPTPSVATATGGQTSRSGSRSDEKLLGGLAQDMAVEWGAYEPAIRRWEYIRGIEAPCPVEPGKNGNPRLSPQFVEWMMGLPPGWVTGIEGLSRAKWLKLLGNGVVPQQVYLATVLLLQDMLYALSLRA